MGLLAKYKSKTWVEPNFNEFIVADYPPVSVDGREKCLNVYDVRLYDDMPACGMNWPPDLPDVTTYLGVRGVLRISLLSANMLHSVKMLRLLSMHPRSPNPG